MFREERDREEWWDWRGVAGEGLGVGVCYIIVWHVAEALECRVGPDIERPL